jgi:predicted signal transduction protein with EAL and GGDEF domain
LPGAVVGHPQALEGHLADVVLSTGGTLSREVDPATVCPSLEGTGIRRADSSTFPSEARLSAVPGPKGRLLAVTFVDLDHLKHVDDSQGHQVRDQLLQQVAARPGPVVPGGRGGPVRG